MTKIVATLGPASNSPEMIAALVAAGVNCFRLNFSHGSHEDHLNKIKIIRTIEQESDLPIGIIADLQGPKLRIHTIAGGEATLTVGNSFELMLDRQEGSPSGCSLCHQEIFAVAHEGMELLLDDGRLRIQVTQAEADKLQTRVLVGGVLKSNKGINLPGVHLPISALTKRDRVDLEFALEHGADWIALSFVQSERDLLEARKIIGTRAKIIAKIEKPLALKHIDQIIDASDAIMVARGDLGVECDPADVPVMQKMLVRKARAASRAVIVATQMLESMTASPTPTRAEASDVATALYDGTDAVMLSAESASGKYPRESVEFMRRIINRIEQDPEYRFALDRAALDLEDAAPEAIVAAARRVSEVVGASCIVTFSKTGNTTQRASRLRPTCPLLGLTPLTATARMTTLYWGVRSILTPDLTSLDDMTKKGVAIACQYGFASAGDALIITAGIPLGRPGRTNLLRLTMVGEDLDDEVSTTSLPED